ncbi:MAG TPA: hypothetical protein ENI80_01810 [Acidiferrobacteraceae bacterium]|mgnify:CR=1 FL=1|nr:hypothetical protein [Acidiferrobacteraceae bacterium]
MDEPAVDPFGFLGIKWGADISQVPNMKPRYKWERDPELSEIKMYVRTTDKLKIGGKETVRPVYTFYKGMFGRVSFRYRRFSSFKSLKVALDEAYGEPDTTTVLHASYSTKYTWTKGDVIARLFFSRSANPNDENSSLEYTYMPIKTQMDRYILDVNLRDDDDN